jgi:ubiquitin-conjugating enzyme E2 O
MEGHDVGSKVPEEDKKEVQDGEGSSSSSVALTEEDKPAYRSPTFNPNLEVLFEELLMEFNVKGADTAKFREQKLLKSQQAAA